MIKDLNDDWRDDMERLLHTQTEDEEIEKKEIIETLVRNFPENIGKKYRFFKMISYKPNTTIDFILYGYIPNDAKISVNNKFDVIVTPGLRCVQFQDDKSKNKSYRDIAPLLFDMLSNRTDYVDIDITEFLSEWTITPLKSGITDVDKNIMEKYEKEIAEILSQRIVANKREKKTFNMSDEFDKINNATKHINKKKDEFDLPDDFFNNFNIDFNDEWEKLFEDKYFISIFV